ncbi:hypothetical protein ASE74_12380 [Pedobacter sp. Leaf216]|uniref:hypothetical protein n=1 Tax=Pedobacter sp. Leaf216 TaxID=1735684 RepID=UPI0006FE531B|nr:hypothetical protein [Pedobacter sp. Leaf216]KQM63957.1 hypothetical protein ASE74_12380 [Pedobacter sp. Leaf216]
MPYSKQKVSLQINLSPGDYQLAKFVLPHQLKILAGQVDEILLTIESKPSKGRFSLGWEENEAKLKSLLEIVAKQYTVRIIYVDYTEEMKKKVAKYFFLHGYIPEKDFRGGPFYCYFFGMYNCSNDLIFHLDADIFLGGKDTLWISKAATLLAEQNDILSVSPLPGPPAKNEILIGQHIIEKFQDEPYKFQLSGFSTRIFMIKKSSLHQYKLRIRRPCLKDQLKAILAGNPTADLPEHLISNLMQKKNLKRVDFLGSAEGIWSLHPPYRSSGFYARLPLLIQKIENNDLPVSQHGFYDIVDDVVDWSEAREKLRNRNLFKFTSFFRAT